MVGLHKASTPLEQSKLIDCLIKKLRAVSLNRTVRMTIKLNQTYRKLLNQQNLRPEERISFAKL